VKNFSSAIFLVCLLSVPKLAAASEASVMNEFCQDRVQIGTIYPTISTFAGLTSQFSSWSQWTQADIASLPGSIVIDPVNTSFNNGVLWIYFTVNGKSGQAVAWARNFGKTADGPTYLNQFGTNGRAVLIIPGSGNNESVAMMAGTGYEAVLFSVATQVGDGFVYSYPGEDMQGLVCANGNKIILGQIDSLLSQRGSYASHLVIVQTAVIMKFLQTSRFLNPLFPNYTEIGIMGLSKGAWNAMMTAMITPPTAAVIASGISVKEYREVGFGVTGWSYSPAFQALWPQASLIAAIQRPATKWLFTESRCPNELSLVTEEVATGETAAAFAGPNVTFDVHCQGHVYPAPDTLNFFHANMP
jgi:hypothetical protein